MKKILITLIFLTAGSLQAGQALAHIIESVMGNAPKTIDGVDYVGQYVPLDDGSKQSGFIAAGLASDAPKGINALKRRNPNALLVNYKKCLIIADRNSLLCFKKKGGMSEIYPATPIPDPKGKTFVPIIGPDNNGNLTIKNQPHPSTIVQGFDDYQSYLVFGSFGEQWKGCKLRNFTNIRGLFNGMLVCPQNTFGAILPALTAQRPDNNKLHTPAIWINKKTDLVDGNKNGSYDSILSKFLGGGKWGATEKNSGGCFNTIYHNSALFTNCDTGHCNSKSHTAALGFEFKHSTCSRGQILKVNQKFRNMLKDNYLGNQSGYPTWKSKKTNQWNGRPETY